VSDQETGRSGPKPPYVFGGFLFCPFVAGVGAFLGGCVALTRWGEAALRLGAGVGAGIVLLLLGAWVVVSVVRAKDLKVDPMAPDHMTKVCSFIEDMKGRGVNLLVAAPFPFWMVWPLGFKVPPPLFLGFWSCFLWLVGFGVFLVLPAFGLLFWGYAPNFSAAALPIVAPIILLTIAVLGACGAAMYRRKARRYQLPAWDGYPSSPGAAVGGGN